MAAAFGLNVRFTARPGQAEALVAILLEAAGRVMALEPCRLYVVSRSPADRETVWVNEMWTNREAHDAMIEEERAAGLIQRAMPLLAGPPEATELSPIGGKGV